MENKLLSKKNFRNETIYTDYLQARKQARKDKLYIFCLTLNWGYKKIYKITTSKDFSPLASGYQLLENYIDC